MSSEDAMAFQKFASELHPVFVHDSMFAVLPQVAFQCCITEVSVLRAMVAMMSGHDDRVYGFGSTLIAIRQERSIEPTMLKYSRALIALGRQIQDTMSDTASEVPIIVAGFFLMCFELFQGRTSLAQHHLLNIKQIAQQASASLAPRSSQERLIVDEVQNCFQAVDLGLAQSGDPDLHGQLRDLEALEADAEQFRERLLRQAQSRLSLGWTTGADVTMQHCLASCLAKVLLAEKQGEDRLSYDRLLYRHLAWRLRFKAIADPLASMTWLATIKHFFSLHALRLLMPTRTSTSEFEVDANLILDLVQRYHEIRSVGDDLPVVSVTFNILRALYLIAVRSNRSTSRDDAIRILQTINRRESTVSSDYLAAFATVVNQIAREASTDIVEMPHEVVNPHERGRPEMIYCITGRIVFDAGDRSTSIQLKQYTSDEGQPIAAEAIRAPTWRVSWARELSLAQMKLR